MLELVESYAADTAEKGAGVLYPGQRLGVHLGTRMGAG